MHHPIEVIVFQNEEGGLVGSLAMAGALQPAALEEKSQAGVSIGDGIRAIGGNPDQLRLAARGSGSIAAYVELHIEQGSRLADEGIDMGVVEGIVAISWWDIAVEGRANHAGTTPMAKRHDALLAAAQLVIAVNDEVRAMPGSQVATVGRLRAFPGGRNVIPGGVEASLEIRDLDTDKVTQLFERIRRRSQDIAQSPGASIAFRKVATGSRAELTDAGIRRIITRAADDLGLSHRSMPSGAGHDAQAIARIAPIGTNFIPSAGA